MLPKLMLLTVAEPVKRPFKLCVKVEDFLLLESWLTMDNDSLDGVHLQFEKKMMTEAGAANLCRLSEIYCVGI